MRAEKDSDAIPPERGDDAVERSLEDFIARANSTLPAVEENTQPRARLAEAKRRRRDKSGTLVVLGSQEPLAEVTEIVQRLPTGESVDEPVRRGPGWKVLLAFVAGAVVVLAITKLLTGSRPQAPALPPPPARHSARRRC